MAYDFLGTFGEQQVRVLLDWVELHVEEESSGRIEHLRRGVERLGWVRYSTDNDGEVTGFSIEPSGSLLDRQVRAYQFAGGDLVDLDVLSRGNWIYLTKGEFELENREFRGGVPSHGEYSPAQAYADADSAIEVSKLKETVEPTLKRLEDLEFRIKRTVDLLDRYVEEVILLAKRTDGVDTIDDLRKNIEWLVQSEDHPFAGQSGE